MAGRDARRGGEGEGFGPAPDAHPSGDACPWIPAPPAPFEASRLRELASLDLGPEALTTLGQVTRLVQLALDVPVALVSLVEGERQRFPARSGLEVESTPRDVSFCAYAIREPSDQLIVEDATLSRRFASNPLVVGSPHLRAYAGVVLRGRSGQALGTLCAVDTAPRAFSDGQIAQLKSLARLVEHQIAVATPGWAPPAEAQAGGMAALMEAVARRQADLDGDAAPDEAPFALLAVQVSELIHSLQLHEGSAAAEGLEQLRARVAAELAPFEQVAVVDHDHLVVLLSRPGRHACFEARAAEVAACVLAPLTVDGVRCPTRPSFGLAFPQPGEGARARRGRARVAARLLPREPGDVVRYDSATRALHHRRLALARRLPEALDGGDLRLVYQPIWDARSRALVGAEGLLRWTDAELGIVSPAELVDVAEERMLLGEVSRYVARRVVADLLYLREETGELPPTSINLTAGDVSSLAMPRELVACLEEAGLPLSAVKAEITEQCLLENLDEAREVVRFLSDRGIRVALDDFGTGYSSLGWLASLPVHGLKLDRVFVAPLPEDEGCMRVIHALVALARSLDLTLVGEGVETEAQAEALADAGCDLLQGYGLSRPLEVDRYAALIRREGVLDAA